MRIFLDGCDGTGKSTLAKHLSDRFKLDIFCLTKNSESSIERYCALSCNDDIIHDRTFLSEVVYPKVFGRKERLCESEVEFLLDKYRLRDDDIFVICTAPVTVICDRLNKRGNEFDEVTKNIDYINSAYMQLAHKYELMLVNTEYQTLDEIGDMIERRIEDGQHNRR